MELALVKEISKILDAIGIERFFLIVSLSANVYLIKLHVKDAERYVDLLVKVIKIEQENLVVDRLEEKLVRHLEKVG